MATYNRPGVYIEEVASSFPVAVSPTATIATFMGALAKGPLTPTLISSWSQFTSTYGDVAANAADTDLATAVYLFFANGGSQCYIQRSIVTVAATSTTATSVSSSVTIVSATGLASSDGSTFSITTTNIVGATITGNGVPTGTLVLSATPTVLGLSQNASIPANTVLTITTAGASSVTIKGNGVGTLATQTPVGNAAIATHTPSGTTNITITTGTQAFVAGQSVTINNILPAGYNGTWVVQAGTTSTSLIINIGSNPGAITQAGTVGLANTTTLTTSAAHNLKVGQTVVIAGTAASAHTSNTGIYNGTFVVASLPSTTTFTVANPLSPVSPLTTAGTVTSQSTQTELTLNSKTPGVWGNSLYYDISSSTSSTSYPGKYFNLAIYSGGTNPGNIVERFSDVTMLASDSNYAPTVINASSNYVTAIDSNAVNHTTALFSTTNTPLTTSIVSLSATSTTATSGVNTVVLTTDPGISVGMLISGNGVTSGTTVSSYVASTKTVTMSAVMTIPAATALTFVNAAFTGGSDGTTVNNTAVIAASALAKLDAITQPILINAPGVTATADVNSLLTYAYNRGDVFVIIDPTQSTLDATSQLTLANTYTGGTAGFNAMGFGAVYYPNLTIPSLTSNVSGATVTAYPGGAVAAKYVTTDSSRGVFKSPAGLEARLAGVVAVAQLTSTELDYLNNGTSNPATFSGATPVNAIRYVPGAGIVVMGARTLSTGYQSKYVSVRRSLIYIRKLLTDLTGFALFETNDQRLWARLQNSCESALINFWNSGGLKGATAADAFYVKSDSSINTSASIAAGEVHLEIGVALQRPAEFVVIRISQYDSGSVVTVL